MEQLAAWMTLHPWMTFFIALALIETLAMPRRIVIVRENDDKEGRRR